MIYLVKITTVVVAHKKISSSLANTKYHSHKGKMAPTATPNAIDATA